MKPVRVLPLLAALPLSAALAQSPAPAVPPIDGEAVLGHIRVLASDEFEGRAPGTEGERKTVAYLIEQFRKLGLQPGNPDGSYVQKVPLVGITASPAPLVFRKGAQALELRWREDVVSWTKRVSEEAAIDASEVVFVGYGVEAPEFQWDDYKGADVRGKTLVMLVNDPPLPDPAQPGRLDPKQFGGRAMTYYGRWTYKYEEGARKGAAAVILVHETGPAGYPFSVVQGKTAEQFDLVTPDRNMGRAALEGWITLDKAKALFALGGQDFGALKQQALTRAFRPVPLGVTASMKLRNTLRTIDSTNVVAKLPGADPAVRDEFVVYTAHWDHFGVGVPVNGDRVYNGALDNASGTAGLIEVARAFTRVTPAPRRSILFLAVTAEEQGLLGSQHYSVAPLHPLARTLANVNMDGLNLYGRTKDVEITGFGASELDDYARKVAAEQGRRVEPETEPEKGYYYRSDHFHFAKQGVPALSAGAGLEYEGKPEGYGQKKRDEYVALDYHAPSDEIKPDWDMSGAAQDCEFYMKVGYLVANAAKYPEWAPGTEFRATRERMLKAAAATR
ncbi:MAG: M28 family metallopeptidase [Vicinamibacteria bacterium]